ncbi:hypothetical protein [Mycobacterium lacus]|uniref:Uncharacterized protein n=1 Tax=Mycobacterium lacus TaxID=169765 RepID=A0A1X1YVK9_9MYCO|nr:hypothetical protein [Mycobacterium lacus]MCV7121697.1 hypothetical protein [Mycobacterium lacus]ORW15126.1 hypothetical protein AWC15_11685 [Mycobacterium lacus]BBX94993.1 hypothetical protein MLAC_02870 [Mycobacterium lacus]
MGNVLDLVDQGMFAGERATGTTALLQCVWVYDRAIDIEGLRKFHDHLQRGRLSRLIERSPLPFGRHRWISHGRPSDVEIVGSARPREQFDIWLTEQTNAHLDSERGPGWHLATLPFTDGGSGLSLVIAHCLTDGLGLCEALADAASGREEVLSWPAAGSRRRGRAVVEDLRQTVRDIPSIGRAVGAAARLAKRGHDRAATASPLRAKPPAPTGPDERIALPMAAIFVDADEWDARAHSLGGTGNALLAGLAARLAQRVGRVAEDGSVTLAMPVDQRDADDTAANAVTNIDFAIDPATATTDLREIRAAIKRALIRHQEAPDELWALLPIVPFVPRWLARRLVNVVAGSPHTVIFSNLGAINPDTNRPDGTEADYFAMTSLFPGVTKAMMHRTGGRLALLSARVHGKVSVSVVGYQPGRPNSTEDLRRSLSSVLNDFSLTGTTGW